MFRLAASLTAVLALMLGLPAHSNGTHHKHLTYRQQVVKGTYTYGPCRKALMTRNGRVAYLDQVADSYDDNGRRTVKAQIRYVKQACRNGF